MAEGGDALLVHVIVRRSSPLEVRKVI